VGRKSRMLFVTCSNILRYKYDVSDLPSINLSLRPSVHLVHQLLIYKPYSTPITNRGVVLKHWLWPQLRLKEFLFCRQPLIPHHSAAMSFKESSSYVIHMLARLGLQSIVSTSANVLGTIELVSFRCCRGSLVLHLVGGLRFRRVKKVLRDRC